MDLLTYYWYANANDSFGASHGTKTNIDDPIDVSPDVTQIT